nr:ABC transporter ATP-binding protein [Desulfobacterales bacterium]
MNNQVPEISVRGVSKSFVTEGGRIEVLRGVEFDIFPGEMVAVTGASGIGKSTFLHILGTLDRPDKGRILFRGKDVFQYSDEELARFRNQTVGFVFQFHHLLPEFNALENTMMPALIKGIKPVQAKEMAESLLVQVGLKDRLLHRIGELSGGEQQRVAIARALVLSPLLLLADEPTGNLDSKNSEKIHDLLELLNREYNTTIVVATHNTDLSRRMTRRLTIIDGKMVNLD